MKQWVRHTKANPNWGHGTTGFGKWFKRTSRTGLEGHHSHPKFMGGDPSQPLTYMPGGQHTALHQELYQFLAPRGMAPRAGFGGYAIIGQFGHRALRRTMGEFYRGPGAQFGDAAADFFSLWPGL